MKTESKAATASACNYQTERERERERETDRQTDRQTDRERSECN